jgi:hypothetical protein
MKDDVVKPDWKWGTPEGSRELDRLLDRQLPFREKLEWLEEAEDLTLRLRATREDAESSGKPGPSEPDAL